MFRLRNLIPACNKAPPSGRPPGFAVILTAAAVLAGTFAVPGSVSQDVLFFCATKTDQTAVADRQTATEAQEWYVRQVIETAAVAKAADIDETADGPPPAQRTVYVSPSPDESAVNFAADPCDTVVDFTDGEPTVSEARSITAIARDISIETDRTIQTGTIPLGTPTAAPSETIEKKTTDLSTATAAPAENTGKATTALSTATAPAVTTEKTATALSTAPPPAVTTEKTAPPLSTATAPVTTTKNTTTTARSTAAPTPTPAPTAVPTEAPQTQQTRITGAPIGYSVSKGGDVDALKFSISTSDGYSSIVQRVFGLDTSGWRDYGGEQPDAAILSRYSRVVSSVAEIKDQKSFSVEVTVPGNATGDTEAIRRSLEYKYFAGHGYVQSLKVTSVYDETAGTTIVNVSSSNNTIAEYIRDYDTKYGRYENFVTEAVREAGIIEGMSIGDTCRALNTWIVDNIEYDYGQTVYEWYDVLEQKKAFCTGFAVLFKVLANYVGVDARVLMSEPMQHSYNDVLVDGQRYYVDVTWNHTMGQKNRYVLVTRLTPHWMYEITSIY